MKKKAKLSVAAIAAICALCLMTAVAFASGIPQSIFAELKNRYVSSQGKDFTRMDELAGKDLAKTEDFSIDQAYYDGQQLTVGITYDKSKVMISDGVYLANGDELVNDSGDEGVNADGKDWLYIKFATPLPESAQNKESLEVVFTLLPLDASEGGKKTVTASIPRSTDVIKSYTADREYINYSVHIKVTASPVDTRIDVSLDVPKAWSAAMAIMEDVASVDYVWSYMLIADGKVLDGGINRSAGTEMFGTYAPLPENTTQLVLRPVYTLTHENSAEDIVLVIPQE